MSRNDEPLTAQVIWESAEMTLRAHAGDGHCYSCTADGCPQLDWAYEVKRGGEAAKSAHGSVPLAGVRRTGRDS